MIKKICAISDIHGYLPDIKECDVLCICGDIIPLNIQRNVDLSIEWLQNDFHDWVKTIPVKQVVMTWGNHDFVGEKLYEDGITNMSEFIFGKNNNIHILIDELKEIEGINFYGTPWCPNLRNWAFYGDEEFLKNKFSQIKSDTQILLTHCPPKHGQQGIVLQQCWNFLNDFGCQELEDAIQKIFSVKSTSTYILSGHIHSGNHQLETENGLSYINVSLKDENYNVAYYPYYFDYYINN